MKRILITGMSGTGKSTVIQELAARGWRAVDLDGPEYSHLIPAAEGELTGVGGGMDWVWREDRVAALLDSAGDEPLFLSGCSPNQGRFSRQLDAIVLLTVPLAVMLERLATRSSNSFGQRLDEVIATLQLVGAVEPLLREQADLIIDTTEPLEAVVNALVRLVESAPPPAS